MSEPTPEPVRISEGGRIVVPAEYRRALGLEVGDTVLVELADGELRVFTPERAIRRAQEILATYMPRDHSLADELIAERHAEAERE